MTLEQLDSTLPHGLHDAQLRRIIRNFEDASLKLDVRIAVGLAKDERQLQYRDAAIDFQGVQYFVSEYPDSTSLFRDPGCLWWTFSRSEVGVAPEGMDQILPSEILRYSFFIREWYASFHVAAKDLSFEWL